MIDTGFNSENCLKELEDGLEELRIEYNTLDIFITHRHFDHCSLARIMAEKGATIYMNSSEERHAYDCLTYKPGTNTLKEQATALKRVGLNLEPDTLEIFMEINNTLVEDGKWFLAIESFPYKAVETGCKFTYGKYTFKAIPLKGHTYGQMGLVDKDKKIFFCADQIIDGVSPIVATTFSGENLLYEFFSSLKNISDNYRDYILIPAHGQVIKDPEKAINPILESYDRKIERVKELFLSNKKSLTVLETARAIYDYYSLPKDIGEFFQFKMILTKTSSILEYLNYLGFLKKENINGTDYYGQI